MNRKTGEIKRFEENEDIPDLFQIIQEDQMTEKQKTYMAVSKYDGTSELGKLFTENRAERRLEKKRKKNK